MDDLDATQAKDGSGTQASTGRSTAGTSEDGKKAYWEPDRYPVHARRSSNLSAGNQIR